MGRGVGGPGARAAGCRALLAACASLRPRVSVLAALRGERGRRPRRAGTGSWSSVTPESSSPRRACERSSLELGDQVWSGSSVRPRSSGGTAEASPRPYPPLQLTPPFSPREVNLTTTKKYVQNPDVPCTEPQRGGGTQAGGIYFSCALLLMPALAPARGSASVGPGLERRARRGL